MPCSLRSCWTRGPCRPHGQHLACSRGAAATPSSEPVQGGGHRPWGTQTLVSGPSLGEGARRSAVLQADHGVHSVLVASAGCGCATFLHPQPWLHTARPAVLPVGPLPSRDAPGDHGPPGQHHGLWLRPSFSWTFDPGCPKTPRSPEPTRGTPRHSQLQRPLGQKFHPQLPMLRQLRAAAPHWGPPSADTAQSPQGTGPGGEAAHGHHGPWGGPGLGQGGRRPGGSCSSLTPGPHPAGQAGPESGTVSRSGLSVGLMYFGRSVRVTDCLASPSDT